jgi:hypothetical protein
MRILLHILLCLALGASETAAEPFLDCVARKEQTIFGLGVAGSESIGKLLSDIIVEMIRESEWL